MNSKKIYNIVFFKFNGEQDNMRQACVFYSDGSAKLVSDKEGIKLGKELLKENGITVDNFAEEFRKLVNKRLIHVVSGRELERNFNSYMPVKKAEKAKKAAAAVVPASALASEVKRSKPLEEEDFKRVKARKTKKEDKKKKPFRLRVAAAALAAVVGLSGMTFALSKIDKSGKLHKNNIKTTTAEINNDDKELVQGNNDYYDSYTYEELLEVTQNADQKAEMKRIHDALYGYNIDFANNYIEEDKDIKAALTFREVVALSQAYNDFTPAQIKAIFNGQAITAAELDSAYKTATLQLMGAHVIETREHPVDMSGIIVDEEGKAFYEKYHNLFLNAKEATGDEKIAAVEAFYNELRSDFPIDPDTREVGISHADSHQVVDSYKLAITPMVAAGEIMWQNLDIDKTLQGGVNTFFFGDVDVNELSREDLVEIIMNGNAGVAKGEIDYFNDLGLCNLAEEKYEIIQQITMGAFDNVDKTNPRFDQYENAMVKELTDKDSYVIDDAHRELSELDRFQDQVNWHFEVDEYGYYTGSVYYTTETHTRTRTWKKTKTTKRTEITRTEKEITDEAKKEVDKELEEENKKTNEEEYKESEENREKMQEEEDKKAEEIKEEVRQDEEDMQDKIEDANDKIKENQDIIKENEGKPEEEQKPTNPVNEEDFGDHNVVFDDEHKDDNGNLNDSVENITTDDTDVKTENDLPDPNETGKKFDEEGEKQSKSNASETKTESKPEVKAESKPEVKSEPKVESKPEVKSEPKAETSSSSSSSESKSREEKVKEYVDSMANTSDADEDAKELQK